jgi:hypothetical protein
MNVKKLVATTALITSAFVAVPASAASYVVSVFEASIGSQFDATLGSTFNFLTKPDLSTAVFTYTGPLSFSNTNPQSSSNTGDITSTFFGANAAGISNYIGSGPSTVAYGANGANFKTLAGFLATSGSAANFAYGSLYTFTTFGNFNNLELSITHDDGVSLYADGVRLSGLTAGPTSAITEKVRLPNGTRAYTLVYGRENGSPSILNVAAVPEPATWAMMLVGFGMMGAAIRYRRRNAKVVYA